MGAQAEIRIIRSATGAHIFLADGSRLYDVDEVAATQAEAEVKEGKFPDCLKDVVSLPGRRYISQTAIAPPQLRSISLNVAQACNMSCGYCYADRGRFGGKPALMDPAVARHAVDALLEGAPPSSDLVVGFMGGEPLLNRSLIRDITRYAHGAAESTGHRVGFSLTTNGTLLTEDDARFFADYPFSVTVSLDGDAPINDGHRAMASGQKSAHAAATAGIKLLTKDKRPRHVSIRATVSPATGTLLPLLEHFFSLDVDEAGFAPVLSAPPGFPVYSEETFKGFTEEMIRCGKTAKEKLFRRNRFPFSNFETALHEIHRGTHRPYPCGAGAGYMSVGARGDYYACHRLVGDPNFLFGDLGLGIDNQKRAEHLERRHVDRQEPCRSCWARYLCGGGCYHEVERRGRVACDYIRTWLEFSIASYAEVSLRCPTYFSDPSSYFRSRREV